MPTTASAVLAVITVLVTVELWGELRAERQSAASLRTALEAARHGPGAAAADSAPPAATPPAIAPPTADPLQTAPGQSPASATPTLHDTPQIGIVLATLDNDLLQDDEYREARLTQLRLRIRSTLSGMAAEMGLLDAEAEALYDLLARQTLARTELVLPTPPPGGSPDLAAMSAIARQQQTQQREHEEALAALLGDFRYEQYRDFQQTQDARRRASSMSRTLAMVGMPLSSNQSRAVTTAVVNEFRRQQREPGPPPPLVMPTTPQAREQMTAYFTNRSLESTRQFLEAAAPHLGARQLQILRQEMEAQEQLNRASRRLQMEQLEQAMPVAARP